MSVVILNSDHMPFLEVAVSVFCQGTQVIETSCASCFLVVQIMLRICGSSRRRQENVCEKALQASKRVDGNVLDSGREENREASGVSPGGGS